MVGPNRPKCPSGEQGFPQPDGTGMSGGAGPRPWLTCRAMGSDTKHEPQRLRLNFNPKGHLPYTWEGTVSLPATWRWQKSSWYPHSTFPKQHFRLTAGRMGPSSVIIYSSRGEAFSNSGISHHWRIRFRLYGKREQSYSQVTETRAMGREVHKGSGGTSPGRNEANRETDTAEPSEMRRCLCWQRASRELIVGT